jgi:isopentenyl diphosphate isomerase/L-lactate dehydrogenase-like FMN-dependent dehydrogenase
MCNSEAELASARAAGRAGTIFAVSGAASCTPAEIMDAASGPLWYQLYMAPDLGEVQDLLTSVASSGYRVLCVTVDNAVDGARNRDWYNRMSVPLEPSPQLLWAGLSRPAWSKDFVLGKVGRGRGFKAAKLAYWQLATTISNLRSVTLDDIRWLRERWDGPLVVKGVMRGEEVPELIEIGVDGVVVSNHGGRNLDGARPTLDILPEVVAAADGRIEVFLDGGVRRGSDVLKALGLGARACLVGRPYLYGLAAGGEDGVHRVLEILRLELEKAMALAGCPTVESIDDSIVHVDGSAGPPSLWASGQTHGNYGGGLK